jgi:hypothetical protein
MQQHKNTILMKILAQLKQLKNTQLKQIMQQHKNAIFSSKKKNFKMEIRQKLTGNILLCDFSQHGSAAFLCKPKQWRHSTKMKF